MVVTVIVACACKLCVGLDPTQSIATKHAIIYQVLAMNDSNAPKMPCVTQHGVNQAVTCAIDFQVMHDFVHASEL